MAVDGLPQVGDRVRFRRGVTDVHDNSIRLGGFTGKITSQHHTLDGRTLFTIEFDDDTVFRIQRSPHRAQWLNAYAYITYQSDFDVIEEVHE